MDPDTLATLSTLRRQYLQLVEPAQLRWPDPSTLIQPHVQAWIFSNMFNPDHVPHPAPTRYQHRVLRLLVSKLEAAIDDPEQDEISDDLMSLFSSLLCLALPPESESAQQKAFVTYSYPRKSTGDSTIEEPSVTVLESPAVLAAASATGLRTWEPSQHLGAFLVSDQGREIVRGRRVLELGAGTGMLSILCAKHLDVAEIVATDGDEAVVDAINTNLFLNGIDESSSAKVHTAALRWGGPVNAATFPEDFGMDVPEVLLGADVVSTPQALEPGVKLIELYQTYDRSAIPSLVSAVREFLHLNSNLEVLIAASIRNEKTFQTFLNACDRNGFSLEQLECPLVPERYQAGPFYSTATPIQICRITRS